MAKDINSILIKDISGQFKTVNLALVGKDNSDGVTKKLISGLKDKEDRGMSLKEKDKKVEEMKREIIKELESEGIKEQKDEGGKKEITPSLIPAEATMPAFYFNLEDEQEVAQFRDKEQILKDGQKQKVLAYLIEEVIKESNLSLSTNIISRLKRVIYSRWCEVRDLLETKEVLTRPRGLGGVGLDNNQAQNILKIIEDKRIKIQEEIERVEAEQKGTKTKELKEIEEQKTPKKEVQREDILSKIKPSGTYVHPSYRGGEQVKGKAVSPAASILLPVSPSQGGRGVSQGRIPGQVIATSQEIIPPPQGVKREPVIKKPIINEAVLKPELVGPVEEMASFDLESFRQLGTTYQEVIEKIKNKIELLQDESFEKRAKGIQAWRSSPVYQNYLTLGRQSIEQGKSVSEIIKEKQSKNQPTLSFEEFEAVADLNEELNV